jgi:DNA polymerase-3 subunit gamma/tau
VSLIKFENGRMEISFNNNLDKSFVKDLSTKLLEWTNKRWIITFSKNIGEATIKEKKDTKKKELIEIAKRSDLYKIMLNNFPDAELVDSDNKKKEND